jgi:hypothetical protein
VYQSTAPAVGYCSADAANFVAVCVNVASGPQLQQEIINGAPAPAPLVWKRSEIMPTIFRYRFADGSYGVSASNLSVGTQVVSHRLVEYQGVADKLKHRSVKFGRVLLGRGGASVELQEVLNEIVAAE